MSLPITVYTPESDLKAPLLLFRRMWADLSASRNLAWQLAKRDIKAQYRDSLLGILWAFITPLFTAATWLVLNMTGIIQVADTDIPYPVYVFTGTMLWTMFTEALNSPLGQMKASQSMVSKLNFPREAILLAGLLKVLHGAVIKLIILLPVIMLMGVFPDWHLLLFPIAMGGLILVGFALGLLLLPIGMLYSDIGRVVPMAVQATMYITPVVFAMPKEGWMHTIFSVNFMTPMMLTARAWLTGQLTPMPLYFAAVFLCAVLLVFFGWVVFRITLPAIIERMSA